MGIDTGSVYTKGVLIDKSSNIIISDMVKTDNNSIEATKKLISNIKNKLDFNKYEVVGVGVTGSSKQIIGSIINSKVIKNEIFAIAKGTVELYPDVKTIFEIGETDSKIIILENGKIKDYLINNYCFSITGALITNLKNKLNINNDNFKKDDCFEIELNKKNLIFLVDDVFKKVEEGYSKKIILYNLYKILAINYMDYVVANKKISGPIVFNGGFSKNKIVIKNIKRLLNKKVIVDKNSLFVEALGIAILVKENEYFETVNLDDVIFKLNSANINNNFIQVI